MSRRGAVCSISARRSESEPEPTLTSQLTRRRLLQHGGTLAAGSLAARALPAWAQPVPPTPALRKCLSLAGHHYMLVPDGDVNDYRLWGNREYIRSSGTSWVKLWVPWGVLQEGFRPRSRAESWAQLGVAPAGEAALHRLDRQVRAANDDGVGVMLTLTTHPTWSGDAHLADRERGRKPLDAKLGADVGPDSPWAWFVGYVLARYRKGAPPNPYGPREPLLSGVGVGGFDGAAGNPYGAYADAVEICNEPNQIVWPLSGLPERVATMITTAVALSDAVGGAPIIAPGTSDTDAAGKPDRLNWREFTIEVLAALGGRRFGERFGWSHHNYNDTREGLPAARTRAAEALRLVRASGVGDGRLWLTESGLDLYPRQGDPAAQDEQARLIERNFSEMATLPGVHMWTQHVINDVPQNNFKSGLRADFTVQPAAPGRRAPRGRRWSALPG